MNAVWSAQRSRSSGTIVAPRYAVALKGAPRILSTGWVPFPVRRDGVWRWEAEYRAAQRRSFFRRYPDIDGDDLKKAEEFFRDA